MHHFLTHFVGFFLFLLSHSSAKFLHRLSNIPDSRSRFDFLLSDYLYIRKFASSIKMERAKVSLHFPIKKLVMIVFGSDIEKRIDSGNFIFPASTLSL